MTAFADPAFFHQLLGKAVSAHATDIHLKVGQPPGARIRGDMVYFKTDRIAADDTEAIARHIVRNPKVRDALDTLQEYDTSYEVPDVGRFRVNLYRQRSSLAAVMRYIPTTVPNVYDLGLPGVARELAEKPNGLVLVTGAAGHGKSTSIAAMIGHLNTTKPLHIVTIEDPIEYVHTDQQSSISQREVGLDTGGFAQALRAALRQDPDVIFVGEIRDDETMEVALKAAETGHLVMSTLHTPDATRTVTRMLALMKGDAVENRTRIASALQGIIAQRLLPRSDGQGVILATEILVATLLVRDAIRRPENNPPLKALMEKGVHPYGMRTLQMHLDQLLEHGFLSDEAVREALGQT